MVSPHLSSYSSLNSGSIGSGKLDRLPTGAEGGHADHTVSVKNIYVLFGKSAENLLAIVTCILKTH